MEDDSTMSIVGSIVMGFARHAVTTFGGGLVAQGLITQQQDSQAIGAVMVLIGVAFSAYSKWKVQQAHNAAVLAAAQKGGTTS